MIWKNVSAVAVQLGHAAFPNTVFSAASSLMISYFVSALMIQLLLGLYCSHSLGNLSCLRLAASGPQLRAVEMLEDRRCCCERDEGPHFLPLVK